MTQDDEMPEEPQGESPAEEAQEHDPLGGKKLHMGGQSDEELGKEAQDRFKYCEEWELNQRGRFMDDLKFAEADPDNGYQWPLNIKQNRDLEDRPCLTINKVRQHNLNIINEIKKNKPGMKVLPVGGDGTYEAAQIYLGMFRHIEYTSNASVAYSTATEFQVKAGIGYWRVVTDYEDDTSFEQALFIRRVKNPLSVYMDPDMNEFDGSDARFGFVFDDVPKDLFDKQYPKFKDKASQVALDNYSSWVNDKHVRIAEYFRIVDVPDVLYSVADEKTGARSQILKSQINKELEDSLLAAASTLKRKVMGKQTQWFKIVGETVVDRRVWAGKYIPIVRVVGEETIIDGVLDRKGHTRAMKDAQRMYNYWSSSAVENVALQSKTPFIAPAAAIEGFETYWETANLVNYSFLPYNNMDDNGQKIDPPMRQSPPVMPQAYLQGMTIATQEIMATSGQWQSQMGSPSNERSGKAINERQEQSELSTYHFSDNMATAIRFTGKIIIDLIPKIYDTERVTQVMAEDGNVSPLQIDPTMQQAAMQMTDQRGEVIHQALNPKVGRYEIQASTGPGYGTRRQEAFEALTTIITQAPALTNVIGDILLKAGDFPGASEAAERLKRLVPPQALGQGPGPEVQQMAMENQRLKSLLEKTMDQLGVAKIEEHNKESELQIGAFDATTKRLKVLEDRMDPGALAQMVAQLVIQATESKMEAPVPGAQKAPDGQWYLQDPETGQFYRVEDNAEQSGAGMAAGEQSVELGEPAAGE